ncbi:hypothetical protein QQ045_022066 [Rhodiola kirilowii]
MATPSLQPPPIVTNFKLKSMKDLEDFLEEKFKKLKLTTLDKNLRDKLIKDPNYKQVYQDRINKLQKWADKPTTGKYYYPRPTPVDVLIEESNEIITNCYSGGHIYEGNIDGYANQQIHNAIHRMLMFFTVCKTSGNSDITSANMIIAGFSGQLKGWWDNYLTQIEKYDILNRIKEEGYNLVEDVVYTLVVSIIEHFTGKYSGNSESIRTLLQNLRCKTLTDFRWYKDTFLSSVMELPECNSTHWKSKFIDGLPSLFAERITNALRENHPSIPYENYTYGKLIGVCTQEGITLCIEIKLNRQLKQQSFTEKSQLDSDGAPCKQGQPCHKQDSENEKTLYKMQSHFKDMEINMLSFKKTMELLKDVKDPELRLKIINHLDIIPATSEKQGTPKEIINKPYLMNEVYRRISQNKPYLMNEVYRRISQNTEVEEPTSTHDLIIEINNLKREILDIKLNNERLDQRISRIEKGKEWSRFKCYPRRTNTYKVFSQN